MPPTAKVKVKKYPKPRLFDEFITDYYKDRPKPCSTQQSVRIKKNISIGKLTPTTKSYLEFLKINQCPVLIAQFSKKDEYATTIQKFIRSYLTRLNIKKERKKQRWARERKKKEWIESVIDKDLEMVLNGYLINDKKVDNGFYPAWKEYKEICSYERDKIKIWKSYIQPLRFKRETAIYKIDPQIAIDKKIKNDKLLLKEKNKRLYYIIYDIIDKLKEGDLGYEELVNMKIHYNYFEGMKIKNKETGEDIVFNDFDEYMVFLGKSFKLI